jgi:hypothetical protein
MREGFVRQDPMEERIVAALERRPGIRIDAGFAARVAARMPRQPKHQTLAPVIGRRVAFAVLGVLLIGLAAVAPASHSTLALGLEWSLLAEFLGVAVWLGMTSTRSSQ